MNTTTLPHPSPSNACFARDASGASGKRRARATGAVTALVLVGLLTSCTSDKKSEAANNEVSNNEVSNNDAPASVVPAAASQAAAAASSGSDVRVSNLRTITVRGVGKSEQIPDQVTVTLGVETTSVNAAQALKDNNTRASELIKLLKERGVADKDVQTSNLSIFPQYDNTGRRIERYTVNNSVTATLKDIKGAGALIDAAASAAGDAIRVNGLVFGISELGPAKENARAAAVKDGRAQAEQLAVAAGVKLGKLRVIQAVSSSNPQPFPLAEARAAAADASVPLEAGSQQVVVEVDLVFDLVE